MADSNTAKRLVIPASAIVAGSSIAIPLQVLPLDGDAGYKVGINVTLTDPESGASVGPILYEFDTGGEGFFAGIPEEYQQKFPIPKTQYGQIFTQYTSGIQYHGQAVPLNVSFPGSSSDTQFSVIVGFVEQLTDSKPKKQGIAFPIYGHFYGDFGASLKATAINSNNSFSLLTVLSQLGAQYGNGFIVDVGPFLNGKPGTGQLIVGLTEELRSLFPNTVSMSKAGSYPPSGQSLPKQSVNTFGEVPINGNLQVGSLPSVEVGVLFDTGAPTTTFHAGSQFDDNKYAPKEGDLVSLKSGDIQILDFNAGSTPGLNKVDIGGETANDPSGYVNTGLNPFFKYPIMFDLENSVIRFPATQG